MPNNEDNIQGLTREIDTRMSELETMKDRIEAEKRQPNEEERARKDVIFKEVGELSADLTQEKKEVEVRRKLAGSMREPTRPEPKSHLDERQMQYPGLPPKDMRFDNFGENIIAAVQACRPGGIADRRLSRAILGSNEAFPTDGGFLVQQDFSTQLLARVNERSPILPRLRQITIGSNSNSIKLPAIAETSQVSSVWGGIIMYWLGEGATKTPTDPVLRVIELSLKKIAGLLYCTDELLQDAAGFSSFAMEGFAEALDLQLETAVIRGTGAGQPFGILNSPALISVTKEAGQLASTILYENIVKMYTRLDPRSESSAIWAISKSIMPQLMTMGITVGVGGAPVWQPPNGAAGRPYSTLLGIPIVPIRNCSALGTVGDIILFDPNQYLWATKGGPQVATSIHVEFKTDQTVVRLVHRVDGQPAWNSPLTPKDNSGTVSPFIVLETRA
jgi:HK97 family phage major capsid protein